MTGYYLIGTITVQILFLALLVAGLSFGKLGYWRGAIFVLLWLAWYVGLSYVSLGGRVYGPVLFVPYVVLLDATLAIVIAKAADNS